MVFKWGLYLTERRTKIDKQHKSLFIQHFVGCAHREMKCACSAVPARGACHSWRGGSDASRRPARKGFWSLVPTTVVTGQYFLCRLSSFPVTK